MLDLAKVKPYGDTMNDGKIQLSFTLPVPIGAEAEKIMLRGAGLEAVTAPLAIMWGFAAFFFTLACLGMRRPRFVLLAYRVAPLPNNEHQIHRHQHESA